MTNKGIAHIGIGQAKGDDKAMEAVKQAVSSPLLETTIEGASHVIALDRKSTRLNSSHCD